MAIKTFKPYTPARRNMTVSAFDGVDKKAKPERSLVETLKKNAGRNSYGHITVRHRGGGNKRKYRVIDFKRLKTDMSATVQRIEYDPNRSAFIALIKYEDGTLSYILAPYGLNVGDQVLSSASADIKPGNCLPIANIPVGTVIHNIEMHPGKGAQLVRSAGAAAQLMAKENGDAQIRMPSGEVRIIRTNCKACIGQVGNLEHENIQIGKAGRKRHMGWRPTVRGSVMNPCDHPHGGGNKQKYRIIDFKRDKTDMFATVLRLEYDPNRSAYIALVEYEDGERRYVIAPVGLTAGDKIISSASADIKPGNCLPIANIPVGTVIHNIEMHPGKGAQLVRSAGAAAQLMAKENGDAQIRMPSGEVRIVRTNCTACIGQVGNLDHENVQIGKAGRKRHMGWRPTVRGSVMNPCDHPHGGGEGKAPVGRPGPVTPWGKPAMGYKTRSKKNPTNKFIVKRRNEK